MILELNRIKSGNDATIGYMTNEGQFECFTLEDERRSVKVKGETRIPSGYYRIRFREVLSPMTERYRAKYPWFKWHLELQNVPNFDYVYIHIGNTDDDTDGCILVAEGANSRSMTVQSSTPAFEKLYKQVQAALERGESVWIRINDLG